MDEFIRKLSEAMAAEFPWMTSKNDGWEKAARGIVNKMGIQCEPGDQHVATRFYVDGIQ
jgi:hypothetical protein